ncbi:MAG TPA: hypothetical protein VGP33_10055 [Chloroflexota bacterium]|jgi:uncharacterized RDD family membrane protein YckC|nr:hypothetical protein [Chloroflexota bacterium]
MMFLARPEACFCGLLYFLPFIIGVGWVMPDANRRGQPGWLWAALTLPLSWVALLAYVVVRGLSSTRP